MDSSNSSTMFASPVGNRTYHVSGDALYVVGQHHRAVSFKNLHADDQIFIVRKAISDLGGILKYLPDMIPIADRLQIDVYGNGGALQPVNNTRVNYPVSRITSRTKITPMAFVTTNIVGDGYVKDDLYLADSGDLLRWVSVCKPSGDQKTLERQSDFGILTDEYLRRLLVESPLEAGPRNWSWALYRTLGALETLVASGIQVRRERLDAFDKAYRQLNQMNLTRIEY